MPSPPDTTEVVIVGGGTAGLTLALALGRAGRQVVVLERDKQADGANGPPRGEILQPNGLGVLHRLEVLPQVAAGPNAHLRYYHFRRITAGKHSTVTTPSTPLCTFDYAELSQRYPDQLCTTVVLLPQELNRVLSRAADHLPNVQRIAGTRVTGLLRDTPDGPVCGVAADGPDGPFTINTQLVAGADGAHSRVRAQMGVAHSVTPYPEGYLTGLIPRPDDFPKAGGYYYLGRGEILGLFPVSGDTLYFFYLVATDDLKKIQTAGIAPLKVRMAQIHPQLTDSLQSLTEWDQLSFHPCLKGGAGQWVTDGAVLLGNAAHAVNPHTAQGRNLALVAAMTLADRLNGHWPQGDGPIAADPLHPYQAACQAGAEQMTRMGDELVLLWNTANPLLTFARDRGFKTMARRASLRQRVLAQISGMDQRPLSLWERIRLGVGV